MGRLEGVHRSSAWSTHTHTHTDEGISLFWTVNTLVPASVHTHQCDEVTRSSSFHIVTLFEKWMAPNLKTQHFLVAEKLIFLRLCEFYSRAAKHGRSVLFLQQPQQLLASRLLSAPSPPFDGQLLFSHLPRLLRLRGTYNPYGGQIGASWREVLNTRDGQCSESKKTTRHTHTHWLCVWRSDPKWLPTCLTQDGWRGQPIYSAEDPCLCLVHTHTHTKWNRQRETEFVPSHLIYLSTNWTQSPLQCVVSAYKEL